MKLFAQMLLCVFVGFAISSSISLHRYRSELLEVRVIRVVTTREDSSMRFAGNPIPHTIVEYRPPIKQWAIPGVAGEVGDIIYELPPHSR